MRGFPFLRRMFFLRWSKKGRKQDYGLVWWESCGDGYFRYRIARAHLARQHFLSSPSHQQDRHVSCPQNTKQSLHVIMSSSHHRSHRSSISRCFSIPAYGESIFQDSKALLPLIMEHGRSIVKMSKSAATIRKGVLWRDAQIIFVRPGIPQLTKPPNGPTELHPLPRPIEPNPPTSSTYTSPKYPIFSVAKVLFNFLPHSAHLHSTSSSP